MEENKFINISIEQYSQSIIALQKLDDIKKIAQGWRMGINSGSTDDSGEYIYNTIDDDDAMLAICSILEIGI